MSLCIYFVNSAKFQRPGDNDNIRSSFKDSLTKLIAINTRDQVLIDDKYRH